MCRRVAIQRIPMKCHFYAKEDITNHFSPLFFCCRELEQFVRSFPSPNLFPLPESFLKQLELATGIGFTFSVPSYLVLKDITR